MAQVQDILASKPSPKYMGPASSKPQEISPHSRGPRMWMGRQESKPGCQVGALGSSPPQDPNTLLCTMGPGWLWVPLKVRQPTPVSPFHALQSLAAHTAHVRAGESCAVHTCHIGEATLPVSKEKQTCAPVAWHMSHKHPAGRPLRSAMSLQHLLLTSEQLAKKIW